MTGKKQFNTQELVLKISSKNYDPRKYPINDWDRYLDVLCQNRNFQKEAIKTILYYLVSDNYKSIEDLVNENYRDNLSLQEKYRTIEDYHARLQLPKKLSGSIDLATGTGKSYVMYGIAQIALGIGLVDKVLVLGPPSLTIERELTNKFVGLSSNKILLNAIPQSSKCSNPSIIHANETIKDYSICIENVNAIYTNNSSSIMDSLSFGRGERCLVLNDEVHHAYNKTSGNGTDNRSIKKWKEFLLDSAYSFKYIIGFTGTAYIDNDYFNDCLYRYSLRSGIENKFIKKIDYIVENIDQNEYEKFQKILFNHKRNKQLYPEIKPLTILITKDIKEAKQLQTRLVEFLASRKEGTEEELYKGKVLIVTSHKDHRQNIPLLSYVDSKDNNTEWIISVAMLTEGWDVKNVYQIVPMEEKAFNSKLLIAQVLGRGLRIPKEYPTISEVIVYNHDKWSSRIKELVAEILEMETKISNGILKKSDRAKYHFSVYNIKYIKNTKETPNKDTEKFIYKDYANLISHEDVYSDDAKYTDIDGKELKINYQIEREQFLITDIVNQVYNDFQKRRLEGIILDLGKNEYTSDNLPEKSDIESYIRRSMKEVGLKGNSLSSQNKQIIFSTFGTLLRKKPKSLRISRDFEKLEEIKTFSKDVENVSVLGLKGGSTIFYTNNYRDEIISEDSLIAFNEIITDLSLPRSAFIEVDNSYNLKTPVDLVFTFKKPEREFVQELIKQENAEKVSNWIKSSNMGFYSIEYSFTKGTHTNSHPFNPDFFILLKENKSEYISVVEIKSDGDDTEENKQKYKYALDHFKLLNETLKKDGINQKYFFNFLSPENYPDYFSWLRDGKLIKGLFKSALDRELEE
ncbi:DEAD/DEAH box helicase [Leadbettera azotonutricia]|uniref:Type III restriction enzyme, res subunit n=1 Tax=Leadbettera azotonutricia (strain ATCC BAA-888 / DSM 13862 / ZAS-9) TaxID=545695 RepID=F5Y7M1_LEAAZ|nr:DEAD/DEAH box helicase family protein [Leadbettera azotonutricia]AEF81524.1 type III restriction enzyme, res subunit [Leadbettera azotonutricia ZAS-9]